MVIEHKLRCLLSGAYTFTRFYLTAHVNWLKHTIEILYFSHICSKLSDHKCRATKNTISIVYVFSTHGVDWRQIQCPSSVAYTFTLFVWLQVSIDKKIYNSVGKVYQKNAWFTCVIFITSIMCNSRHIGRNMVLEKPILKTSYFLERKL